LLHVIDCATIEPNRDPASDLDKILFELDAYQVPEGGVPLTQRPQLIALNKADVPDAKELAEFVKPDLEARGYKVFIISAVSHEGLRELNFALAALVDKARHDLGQQPVKPRIQLMQSKRDENTFIIKKESRNDEDFFRVLGAKPERWVHQTNFANEEAIGYLADRLGKIGLEQELFKAGAVSGSTVVIGPGQGIVFDWEPTISSAAELIAGPRGTDARFDMRERRTTKERRKTYTERMDAKAATREEMRKEGVAGKWSQPKDFEKED
jgi:GTP-binding protein